MSSSGESANQSIIPYLNPAYWDGHAYGDGDIDCPRSTEFIGNSQYWQAYRNLCISAGAEGRPGVPLEYGENIGDQPNGTVVIFREETLDQSRPVVADFGQLAVPLTNIDLNPSLGVTETGAMSMEYFDQDSETSFYDRTIYTDATYWGVITRGRLTQKRRVQIFPAGNVFDKLDGTIGLLDYDNRHARSADLVVGKVYHSGDMDEREGMIEELARITAARIYRPASDSYRGKKRRIPGFSLLTDTDAVTFPC